MDEATNSSNLLKFGANNASATQKARRLDALSSRLATRGTAVPVQASAGSPIKSSIFPPQQSCDIVGINCIHCQQPIVSTSDARACTSCKKFVHTSCDNESFMDNMGGAYVCQGCRKGPLVGGDAMLPSAMDTGEDMDFSKLARQILAQKSGTSSALDFSNLTSSQPSSSLSQAQILSLQTQFSAAAGLEEELFSGQNLGLMSGMSSPASASITTASTNADHNDLAQSDNEEYKPTSTRHEGRSTRGGRGGAKKKPGGMSRVSSSMRTRSGGKPSIASYAYLNSAGFSGIEASEKPKRGRGGGSGAGKGKGSGRTRGRGRKPGAMYNTMTYLQSSSSSLSIHREGEDRQSMESFESTKQRQLEENDYIRTAIVTNANDPFMCNASLCLICGSVGKDIEGTMITCMSCAQSYHTYCVNMHDKLNQTILKRGWRCLDCTVCEGCGSGKDESNLLLCDECDVAYHTYCLEPKLEKIPSGAWRCKWCAQCCRCSKQVQSSLDLQRLEGLCETCHSLRKCPKCMRLYEVGELLIKCQHCIRWYHAKCEDIQSEEAAENASENAFRCSLCRPRLHAGYQDPMNTTTILDGVMVNKFAPEYSKFMGNFRNIHPGYGGMDLGGYNRMHSIDHHADPEELIMDELEYATQFTGRGRGRGGGPGRRMLKLGIGGFHVKIPRHRLLAMEKEEELAKERDEAEQAELGPNGKPRIRRPRKPRRHALEDTYPPAIQEAFFGTQGVDGKTLLESKDLVDEPILGEYKKSTLASGNKTGCMLSEQSAEALRTAQEQDMLGDIFAHDLGLDMDMGEFDLSELMGEDDDDADTPMDESANDGFSVSGSQTGMLCSPSASSAMGMGDTMGFMDANNQTRPTSQANFNPGLQDNPFLQMQQHHLQQKQQQQQARQIMGAVIQRSNSQISEISKDLVEKVNQATEKWEEDEPLGDKATKAAVLYSNIAHPELKSQYPNWKDRVKHITRLWRTLDQSKRQEYVNKARENRAARQKVPRTRRVTMMPAPVTKSQSVSELATGGGQGPSGMVAPPVHPHMLQLQMQRQMSQPADMAAFNFEQKFKIPSVPSGSNPDTPNTPSNPGFGTPSQISTPQGQLPTPTMQQSPFFQQQMAGQGVQTPGSMPQTPQQSMPGGIQNQPIPPSAHQLQIQQILAQQQQQQAQLAQQQQLQQQAQRPQGPPGTLNMTMPGGGGGFEGGQGPPGSQQGHPGQHMMQHAGQGTMIGQPPPQFMRPAMQQAHPLAHLPREVLEQYDALRKKTAELQQQEKAVEAELGRMKRLKKNLTAKKRSLNKNTTTDPVTGEESHGDLNEQEEQKLNETIEKIPNQQQAFNAIKQEVKAQIEKVKEFETTHGINMQQFPAGGIPQSPQVQQQHPMMVNRSPTVGTPTGGMPGGPMQGFMNPNLMSMPQSTPTTPAGMAMMRPQFHPQHPQTADVQLPTQTPGHPSSHQTPTAFPFPGQMNIRMNMNMPQNMQNVLTPTSATPTPTGPHQGYPHQNQLTSPLPGSRMGEDVFSMHSESPTPSGGRPGSSASLGYGGNFGLEQGVNQPPVKSGRGRKRKKPLEELPDQFHRSPILGGLPYIHLQSDFERDIYDTLDNMVSRVERMVDGTDPNTLKRLLYTHAPPDLIDGPKAKKKRQPQMKKVVPAEFNEYDMLLDKLQCALKMCPPIPPRAFEPSGLVDKQMLQTRETTPWPDRPDKPCIMGHTFGQYKLTFMEDYYSSLENTEIDEESFYPPPMGEIYREVNLRSFMVEDDEDFEEDPFLPEGEEDSKNGISDGPSSSPPRQDLYMLSLNSLGDRQKMSHVEYPGVRKMPEKMIPLEPQRSHFFVPSEPEPEYKITLDLEYPEGSDPADIYNKLCDLLNMDSPPDYELETPPLTPNDHQAPVAGMAAYQASTPGKPLLIPKTEPGQKVCRNCERAIHEAAIQESMSKLGLTPPDDKENNTVSFCTPACYYKFLVTAKIALSVNELEQAERYVDEATLSKLKQIAVDSFAKRLGSGQLKSTLPLDTSFGNAPSFSTTPSPRTPKGFESIDQNLVEGLRAPKEQPIRVAEIAELALQNKAKVTKPEFKFKGHFWTTVDVSLIFSFQRPNEEIRQKLNAIQLQTSDRQRTAKFEDTRVCIFCEGIGDGAQELTGRLLNVDANEWVHVNCALWSSEVFETDSGALTNFEAALRRARATLCKLCGKAGATLKCFRADCATRDDGFHLVCAKRTNGKFIKDKTFICGMHPDIRHEMCVEKLDALRRIYIEREENQLLAKLFNHTFPMDMMMRVGSLVFRSIGQLLPEQLKAFHNSEFIFPIGYKIIRLFWSPVNHSERVRYECVIEDKNGTPEFKVVYEGRDFRDKTPSGAWNKILNSIQQARERGNNLLKFYPSQISGEYLFGLQETAISKMTESLPGVDQLFTYNFRHGGSPLMDVPLALNPSGCARCEPRFRTLIKHRYRPLIMPSPKKKATGQVSSDKFTPELLPREARSRNRASTSNSLFGSKQDPEMLRLLKASGYGEDSLSGAYIRNDGQLPGHIYTLYKKMQQEVPNTVYLARSNIQGLGLYAKRDIDMNSMIIEYLGEVIRSEVGEVREKRYMAQNRGVYMFRIDEEFLVDATMVGGLARYINHSCDPNCSTKILTHNDDKKIIVIANRPIKAGEELTYDYQFELEDTDSKIPCLCGAPNCNKWMN